VENINQKVPIASTIVATVRPLPVKISVKDGINSGFTISEIAKAANIVASKAIANMKTKNFMSPFYHVKTVVKYYYAVWQK